MSTELSFKYHFYERFMEQVKLVHKTVSEVERDLGYPRNALKNYKYDVMPSGARLIELSHYFEVTPEYLIGVERPITGKLLESFFENLTPQQKANIYFIAQKWAGRYSSSGDCK